MRRLLASLALALFPLPLLAGPFTPTGEQKSYVALILHSAHINFDGSQPQGLNDNTPGLSFGKGYELEGDGLERFWEVGVFYNSYEEVAPFALFGYTARALDFGTSQLRLGGFVGVGRYQQLGRTLEAKYGLPYLAGIIPLVGASAIYRIEDHEFRLTTVPGDNIDLILNLSYSYAF